MVREAARATEQERDEELTRQRLKTGCHEELRARSTPRLLHHWCTSRGVGSCHRSEVRLLCLAVRFAGVRSCSLLRDHSPHGSRTGTLREEGVACPSRPPSSSAA